MPEEQENWQDKLHNFIEAAGCGDRDSLVHQNLFAELGGNHIEATTEYDEALLAQHAQSLMVGLREGITCELVRSRLEGGSAAIRAAVSKYPGQHDDGSPLSWPEWLLLIAHRTDEDLAKS